MAVVRNSKVRWGGGGGGGGWIKWSEESRRQNRNVLLSLHVINNSFTLLPFISGYDIVFCQRFLIYVWRIYLIAKVDHA